MIIWCASYPKSGNTWVRAIIASLLYSQNGIFDFKMLKNISLFPKRVHFKEFTHEYSDLKKISHYWIAAQENININGKLKIFKTHNGNYNFSGKNFTYNDLRNEMCAVHVGSLHRRSLFETVGYFSLEYKIAEDYNFLIKCKLNLKNYFIDETTMIINNNGVSNKNYLKKRSSYS